MKDMLFKWLSALLVVCLLLSAPMALMEEAPKTELEGPVDEVALELGGEEEESVVMDDNVVELGSEPLEAELDGETPTVEVELFEEVEIDPYEFFELEEDEQFQRMQVKMQSVISGRFNGDFAVVEGKSVGTGSLVFTSSKNRNYTLQVKVIDSYAPESIILNEGKGMALEGGEEAEIPFEVKPDGARDDRITWTSSNPSVAAVPVDEGVVRANRAGKATIYATCYNGVHGEIEVTVTSDADDLPQGVAISASNFPNEIFRNFIELAFDGDNNGILDGDEIEEATRVDLGSGDIHDLWTDMNSAKGIELLPNLTHLDVSYCGLSSLDVSKNPKLEVLNCEGNEKLTTVDISNCPNLVAAYKGKKEEDEELGYNYLRYTSGNYKLTVGPKTSIKTTGSAEATVKVTLDIRGEKTFHLSEKTLRLRAAVEPVGTALTWKSSNTKAATVDKNGVVTLKADGKTQITVTAGKGKTAATDTLLLTVVDDTIPKKVHIEYDGEDTVGINKTLKLAVSVEPETANKAVTWKSSNTKVATVDKNGIVKTKKDGQVTFTASAVKGNASGELKLTVVDDSIPKSVEIDYDGGSVVNLSKGKIKLKAIVKPATADQNVTWKVSPSGLASIGKDGVLTLKKHGEITVTVTTKKNKLTGKPLKLTIEDDTIPKSIEIVPVDNLPLEDGRYVCNKGQKVTFKPEIEPETAKAANLTWKVTPSSVASIKNGVLTTKKQGKATITVSVNGTKVSDEIEIFVKDNTIPESIIVKADKTGTIDKRDTVHLSAVALPSTAVQTVKWKLTEANPKGCAAVNSKGILIAKKPGVVTVTATSTKDKNVTGKITIVIEDLRAPSSIAIDQGSVITLKVKASQPLTAKMKNDKGYTPESKLTWKSNNTSVAKVSKTGVVTTGKNVGTAVITVTTENGKTASITINVTK